jgi:GNAT superfamily N-acetyltransferase
VSALSYRLATAADVPSLRALMKLAIDELQKGFIDASQIAASHQIMGLDTQLIEDRTYFVISIDGRLAGCGGWGKRKTLYGGDHSTGRSGALLDPASEPARIRAMYTHPDFARRGVGRLILALGESAAAREGFRRLRLGATLAGEPLYRAYGFLAVERVMAPTPSGVETPLVMMEKRVDLAKAEEIIAFAAGDASRGEG